jgi:hypothetical protein
MEKIYQSAIGLFGTDGLKFAYVSGKQVDAQFNWPQSVLRGADRAERNRITGQVWCARIFINKNSLELAFGEQALSPKGEAKYW